MERVVVAVLGVIFLCGVVVDSAPAMSPCGPPAPSCPPKTMVTKMVPCVKTEMVAEVMPFTRYVPVKKIGYKKQNVMLRGAPVGKPCGMDPCTQCSPQPFCQVVQQMVPYEYYEPKPVTTYNVVYKPVQRRVMMPQTYCVEAVPMCK